MMSYYDGMTLCYYIIMLHYDVIKYANIIMCQFDVIVLYYYLITLC